MKLYCLVLFTSVLCAGSEGCYDCEVELHRKATVECAHSPSDCGPCISGFAEDDHPRLNPCYKIEVRVSPPPRILTEAYNGKVQLPCEFSGKVMCGWTQDGRQVDIYDSYRFNRREKTETTDCTLVFKRSNSSDSGVWQCVALSDSITQLSIKSKNTTLKVLNPNYGEFISVEEDHEALLTCFSEEAIDCQWWYRKMDLSTFEAVAMDVQYVDQRKGPKSDCSIKIRYTEDLYIGNGHEWICWAQDTKTSLYKSDGFAGDGSNVYFNSMALGKQTIPLQYYKALDNNGQFTCISNTLSIDFIFNVNDSRKWMENLDGISLKEIESYNDTEWSIVRMTCDESAIHTVITNNKSVPYLSDESPKREIALEVKVETHPKNINKATYGQEVILECGFNQALYCEWSMAKSMNDDFETVDTKGMYIEPSNGPRTNCSIHIRQLDAAREGRWKCSGSLEPNGLKVESKEALVIGYQLTEENTNFLRISFKENSMNGKQISYKQLKSNNGVDELKCMTNTGPQEMRWTIDGEVLSFGNQVQSLNLSVEAIDMYYSQHVPKMYTLQCDAVFNNGTVNGVFTRIAFPTPKLLSDPAFINKVDYNGTVVLSCVFDAPVTCEWTMKNNNNNDFQKVFMSGNCDYLDDSIGPKANCSIRIERMGLAEEGEWMCQGHYDLNKHTDSSGVIIVGQNKPSPKVLNDGRSNIKTIVPLKGQSPRIPNNTFLLISFTFITLLISNIH